MEIKELLQEIGFSKAESIVYLGLLKLGKTKSGNIIKTTELQSSVVHNALNTLIDKGYVTYVLEGKIKHYSSLDPKLIEKNLEAKKANFKRILPELQSIRNQSTKNIPSSEIYETWKGIHAATLELLSDAKKGDIYKYFAAEESLLSKEALDFFKKVDLLKKDKGINVKGIAHVSNKNKLKDYVYSKIRYTKNKIPPAMNIFKDKIIIMSLSNKPIAIVIRSKEISNQYNQLWDEIWDSSRE